MGRLPRFRTFFAIVLALSAALAPGAGRAGEEVTTGSTLAPPSDPCGFYRGQAYGRGLDHFLTEMLWACEAIAVRRRAEMPLSERLLAAEEALERYREALIAAGAAVFVRGRTTGAGSLRPGATDAIKTSLAESTGTMDALEAIRAGY